MGNGRTKQFTQAVECPALLSVVLEAWWKIGSTPGDLVDVIVATAGASLLSGALGDRAPSRCDTARQLGGTGGLVPDTAETPNQSLDEWFTDPDAFLPGNNMDFLVARPQERKNLIAYFKQSAGK
jgi:hypothetical protein